MDGEAGTEARVAYAVGRRVGGAVQRNRLRRRLRVIVAQVGPRSGLYLVGARADATRLSFSELRDVVSRAMTEAEALVSETRGGCLPRREAPSRKAVSPQTVSPQTVSPQERPPR